MSEPYVPVPFVPRVPPEAPPRCMRCRTIVATDFRGKPVARGYGLCPTHGYVRYVRNAP